MALAALLLVGASCTSHDSRSKSSSPPHKTPPEALAAAPLARTDGRCATGENGAKSTPALAAAQAAKDRVSRELKVRVAKAEPFGVGIGCDRGEYIIGVFIEHQALLAGLVDSSGLRVLKVGGPLRLL